MKIRGPGVERPLRENLVSGSGRGQLFFVSGSSKASSRKLGLGKQQEVVRSLDQNFVAESGRV